MIKEVRVEVPKIVHVPVEVVKEVPIEVIKYVDREVIKVVEKVVENGSRKTLSAYACARSPTRADGVVSRLALWFVQRSSRRSRSR